MKHTTITSTWIASPRWAEGWPILNGAAPPPRPGVWVIDPEPAYAALGNRSTHLLASNELARASRFVQPAHRIRYKATHTILRMLLAGSSGTDDAASLRFTAGHHNKPQLSNGNAGTPAFNVSYTEGKSIIGIADGPAIGVDIEWQHRPMVIDDMLPACFSPDEINYITADPGKMRSRFFTLWTRKEAILKLTGEGIGDHLPLFEVLDGESIAERRIIGGHPPERIYLHSFLLGDDYVACYAATSPLTELTVYQL